ncbi:uncharacterized protein LOC118158253, partial [Oxyura jamaicensis]|uniref:uncharacterized protein LOC118158253 n=1 Tax=Oxyura jamaicensis TaxID=8884 RepID=UPI0015A5FCF3
MATPPRVPLLLAVPGGPRGGPRLLPQALAALRGAPAPVHVVAAFGPRGSGTSFLLDQLAGPGKAFPGSPGLWLRCCPHPTRPGHALLLLDAGGFPAPGDEDEDEEDPWFLQLLVLQLLLASVFVYSSGAAAEPREELERLIYVRALPRRLRLLAEEEEEEEEEEGALLRTVLPPFVWSLRGAAVAPEDEAVLEAEGHELRAALGTPPGPEAPVTRGVLALFPEQKLFRLEAGGAGGLPQLCAHLLGCGPKTGLSGDPVGGAYLAALAERAAEALRGAEPLRVARLCRDAEGAALQVPGAGDVGGGPGEGGAAPGPAPRPWRGGGEAVARLWHGEGVTQPGAADARWSGDDANKDIDVQHGDTAAQQDVTAWLGDTVREGDINVWHGDTAIQQDVSAWFSDTVTEGDIDVWHGDTATQQDVSAWFSDTVREGDIANAWLGDTAAQQDVNQSNGDTAAQEDVNTWFSDTVTEGDINAWHGDTATQQDVNAWLGDTVTEGDIANAWLGDTTPPHDAVACLDGAVPWKDAAGPAAGDTPEAAPRHRGGTMEAPLCLVQNGPDGALSLHPPALEVLRGIGQPVVVVAIAGPYRMGKSFLMNRLARRRTGFPLGHTVQAQTKGIWM